MKKIKSVNIIIGGLILISIFAPLAWGMKLGDFDKYRFTEEYYKTIVQFVLLGIVLNLYIVKQQEKRNKKFIDKLLKQQSLTISKIEQCFNENSWGGLSEALHKFKSISGLLEEFDPTEKAKLKEFSYTLSIEPEIDYLINNCKTKGLSDCQQSQNKIRSFLKDYLER
jgi:hypothetical protein